MFNITDIFIGTKQSRYVAFAILAAIITVSLCILFSPTDISMGKKLVMVIFLILLSIPGILLSLFELTCVVTGGNTKDRWWCYYFAWIIAIFLIIYCVIIIISAIVSLLTYNNAMIKVKESENTNVLTKEDANNFAQDIFTYQEEKLKQQLNMSEENTYEKFEEKKEEEKNVKKVQFKETPEVKTETIDSIGGYEDSRLDSYQTL